MNGLGTPQLPEAVEQDSLPQCHTERRPEVAGQPREQHASSSIIGIAATEMFVRSMYEMKTAAEPRNTTVCRISTANACRSSRAVAGQRTSVGRCWEIRLQAGQTDGRRVCPATRCLASRAA